MLDLPNVLSALVACKLKYFSRRLKAALVTFGLRIIMVIIIVVNSPPKGNFGSPSSIPLTPVRRHCSITLLSTVIIIIIIIIIVIVIIVIVIIVVIIIVVIIVVVIIV